MNTLIGNISSIETSETLSLVKMAVDDIIFTAIVIDTPETLAYLKINNAVKLYFKETEVIISKTVDLKISLQNQIPCTISKINKGVILAEISLKFNTHSINAIITTNACMQLNLQENEEIMALIKTNEISLAANG